MSSQRENDRFAVGQLIGMKDGHEIWQSTPILREEAMQILKFNGWTEELADHDLSTCPDSYILVNSRTTIC
jgi:hypothetical protein